MRSQTVLARSSSAIRHCSVHSPCALGSSAQLLFSLFPRFAVRVNVRVSFAALSTDDISRGRRVPSQPRRLSVSSPPLSLSLSRSLSSLFSLHVIVPVRARAHLSAQAVRTFFPGMSSSWPRRCHGQRSWPRPLGKYGRDRVGNYGRDTYGALSLLTFLALLAAPLEAARRAAGRTDRHRATHTAHASTAAPEDGTARRGTTRARNVGTLEAERAAGPARSSYDRRRWKG